MISTRDSDLYHTGGHQAASAPYSSSRLCRKVFKARTAGGGAAGRHPTNQHQTRTGRRGRPRRRRCCCCCCCCRRWLAPLCYWLAGWRQQQWYCILPIVVQAGDPQSCKALGQLGTGLALAGESPPAALQLPAAARDSKSGCIGSRVWG